MTRSQFKEMFRELVDIIDARFDRKNKEYADDYDAFSAFEQGSKIAQLTPEKYIWALATKHADSILRFNGNESQEVIDEKFGDLVLYLFIYWCYARTQGNRSSRVDLTPGITPKPEWI